MKIALTGNPNSGKTTLFNAMTGKSEYVGNWAGVTVDKKESFVKKTLSDERIAVVDLPGAYSIRPFTNEESITSNFILDEAPNVIVHVIDSLSLNRGLFFTTQLLELGIPVVIALNKTDVARLRKRVDIKRMEQILDCKVVEISATQGKGLKQLINEAINLFGKIQINPNPDYSNYETVEEVDKARFRFVNSITSEVEVITNGSEDTLSDKIDNFITKPIIGLTLFALVMYGIFELSINVVGAFIADLLVGLIELFQGFIQTSLEAFGANDFLIALLTDGMIGGVGAVMGFLPLIMVLMFFIALVEDLGFMARIAMILDPLFKKIGLSGKSIIPLIVGYGCSIPGIMASRTIKNEKQRRMTALLTPFIPCGAKVPIIALFTVAFFPQHGWLFPVTYLIAFALIIIIGLFLKRVTGSNDFDNFFIIELPEYRVPSIKRAVRSMIENAKSFAIKAGTVILIANTVVFLMSSFDFSFKLSAIDNSILALISTPIAWLLIPVGFGVWQLAAAAITGLIAKEEVVGTLAVVYAVGSAVSEDLEVTNAFLLQNSMQISAVAALAFMFFNLFTPPCFAAIGAMKTELKSTKWLFWGLVLQLSVGYLVALVVYQVGTAISSGRTGEGFIVAVLIAIVSVVVIVFLTRRRISYD